MIKSMRPGADLHRKVATTMKAVEESNPTVSPQKKQSELSLFLRDFLFLGSSRYFAVFLGMIRGLVLPKLLTPYTYGIWKALAIITDFSRLPQIGVTSALFREVPMLNARNDMDQLATTSVTVFYVNIANALFVASLVFLASFFVSDPTVALAMKLFTSFVILNELFMFMKIYFSSLKQFTFIAQINSIDAVLSLLLVLFLTYAFGLNGLIIGSSLELGIILCIFFTKFRVNPLTHPQFGILPRLVRIGFPVMISGLLMQLLTSIDKIVIISFLGETELGYYALGLTLLLMINQGLYTISSVLSPRIIERYEQAKDIQALKNYVTRPTLAAFYFTPVIYAFMYYVSSFIYNSVLPEYAPGLASFRILLVSGYFLLPSNILISFFLALGKQARVAYIQGGVVLFAVAANLLAINLLGGVLSVAIATAVVMFVYSQTIVNYTMSHYFGNSLRKYLAYQIVLLMPCIYAVLTGLLLQRYLPPIWSHPHPLWNDLVQYLFFLLLYAPVLIVGKRRIFNAK